MKRTQAIEVVQPQYTGPWRLKRINIALLLVVSLLLSGCANLPNVGPFVDATYQLKSAVAESGATVVDELQTLQKELDIQTGYADTLATEWEARNKTFEAIAAYADSLGAITTSGRHGAKAAERVIDSVKGLAEAAGHPLPGSSEAIAVASDTVKLVLENLNKARAAKSLRKAMLSAHPAVEGVVEEIRKDLQDLDDTFRLANKAIENRMEVSYNKQFAYRKGLEDILYSANTAGSGEVELRRLAQVSALLEETNEWYSEYQQKLQAIQQRLRLGRALLKTSDCSLSDWLDAHKRLATALQNRQPVTVQSLVETSARIHTLIERVREL